MSNAEDFLAKKDAIEAIPNDQIRYPNMPVGVFIQEAENLYTWCQKDKDALISKGLDWAVVSDIPVRAGAMREAQSVWFKTRFSREEAQKEWNEKSPGAYDLRDDLLRDLRYGFRKSSELLSRVAEIDAGSGHADMIQDLNDIAVLAAAQTALLDKIGFDKNKLDKAAATAAEMADLLARATTDRSENNMERITRDKAYTYLKLAVDEIRACGQYVFWNNEERYKGYTSPYFKNRQRRGNKPEDGGDVTNPPAE